MFSPIENLLVDKIIANGWRLRRALRIEREMMEDDWGADKSISFDNRRQTLGKALSWDFANKDTYGKYIRYEAHIERGIYKALHELQRIQAARLGQNVPLPVAVDMDISKEE